MIYSFQKRGRMILNKNSKFYCNATRMLEEFLAQGNSIDDLKRSDAAYQYIVNSKLRDENGKPIDLETKFALLGYPRKNKLSKNLREDLIKAIKEYLISGGSFHIKRAELPFFERLNTYSRFLKRSGIYLTHEQIMKDDLGFKEYSDMYYRCKQLENFKYFRDHQGYVDQYRANKKFNAYVKDVATTYGIPIYFVVTLLMDEKLNQCEMETDKIKYTQALLNQYAQENETFVGLSNKNPKIYNAFDLLTRYYSDGSEQRFSKVEWLEIFGLDQVKHRFSEKKNDREIDISDIMNYLREEYHDEIINPKDLDTKTYHLIIKKAVAMGVSVSEIFEIHGLKSNAKKIERLSRVTVNEIPYYDEMKNRRNALIKENLKSKQDVCKEEIFEAKLLAVIQVYEEYKEKLQSYYPGMIGSENDFYDEATLD